MNEGGQPGLGGFGGLFNMVGNPGDYVFGQGGLDDVITQMMELQRYVPRPLLLSSLIMWTMSRSLFMNQLTVSF